MKADFSRLRFTPEKHYSGVLHQQGRVSLDSDWNEDVLTRLYLLQQETIDIVGKCGVPAPGAAFEITAPASGRAADDFSIGGGPGSEGHFYLDGILCRLEADSSYLRQPDFPNPPRLTMPTNGGQLTALVYLEVWPRLITYLEDESLREVALNGPDTATRIRIVAQVKVAAVDPKATTCAAALKQLPPLSSGTLTTLQPAPSQPPDPCRLPDPASYTGRENHLYRIEIHDAGDVLGAGQGSAFRVKLAQDMAAGATSLTLASALDAGQLAALRRSNLVTVSDDDGQIETLPVASISSNALTLTLGRAAALVFQTAKNAVATGGAARFKWSVDNASFGVRVTAISQDRKTLTLSSLGRDEATALREGDLVEICDDVSELRDQRGHLAYLKSNPDPDQFTVALTDPLPASFVPTQTSPPSSPPSAGIDRHLLLRRWDGAGLAKAAFDEKLTLDMNLGSGVEIQFGGFNLQAGDYWQFAARTIDGSIEALVNAKPTGIPRARCPLAVVRWTAPVTSPPSSPPASISFELLEDCRRKFPPLVDVLSADPGIHVTRVLARNANNAATDLVNDTNIAVDRILGGIDVLCDGPLTPATISRPTCFVTIEFPFTINQLELANAVFQTLTLAANVSAGGQVISWRPTQASATLLGRLPQLPPGERGYLMRLFLEGNFIWSTNPEIFLDGDTFGTRSANATNTSLRLPSGDRRRGGLFEMWFWTNPPQVATPFVFNVSAAVLPILRSEGLAELTADLVLVGTGGVPTAAGQPVPTVNIQVFLNTTVTSALLDTAQPPAIDSVLLIDEPSVLNTTRVSGAPAPPVTGVGGQGLSYANGATANVYVGRRPTAVSVVFLNVPIDPPGPNATRTLRIKNIRVNANQLGVSTTGVPSQAIAFISLTGAANIGVNNPQQTVGFVQPGTTAVARRADGQPGTFAFSRLTGVNLVVLQNLQTTQAVTNVFLEFTEGFPAAYKVRSIGSGSPFAVRPQEEAGYDNNGTGALAVRAGDPALPQIGFVTSGTRFRALLTNVPAGVRLFVTTRDVPPGGVSPGNPNVPPMQAVLITSDASGGGTVPPPSSVPPGTGGRTNNVPFAEIAIAGGSGVAVWEWVNGDPTSSQSIQAVRFGLVIASPATPASAGPGSATARLNLAVVSTTVDAAGVGTPIPRFVDVPRDSTAFTATVGTGPIVGPIVGPIGPIGPVRPG